MSAVSTDTRDVVGATKGARTRRRILDVAAQLFAQRGVDAVTLRDIARESGLQAGSVYFHVESKDAVLLEVLGVGIEESVTHVRTALAHCGTDPTIRLAAAVQAHIEARSQLSYYAAVVLGVTGAEAGIATADYRRRRRRYLTLWLELVEAAQNDGVLPADRPPKLILQVLFGAMNGDLQDRWTCAEAADTVLAMLGINPVSAASTLRNARRS